MSDTLESPLDLQQIFDAAPGLFLVLAPDSPRFTILAATDAYLHATRTRRSEIMGRGLFEAFPDNPDEPEADGMQKTRASLARVIELRVADTMALQRHDMVRPQAEGGGFEERHWRPVNSPVINARGELAYLIHGVEDVTESVRAKQKTAEQQALADSLRSRADEADALRDANLRLREARLATLNLMQDAVTARQQAEQHSAQLQASEQRLRLATDAAELGIWTWQPDGDRVSWGNDRPYDILGMARSEPPLTAARFAADFVHPEDLLAFEQSFAHTVQTGAHLFYQGRIHRPNGELRWIEFTGQPVAGTEGSSLRVTGTVQDITERTQAEQRLRQNHATFSNLIENAPFGLYVVDAQFRLQQVSTASRSVRHYRPADRPRF